MFKKQLILMTIASLFLFACDGGENSNKESKESETTKAEEEVVEEVVVEEEEEGEGEVMGNMNNQGVGPYKDIKFDGPPKPEMVAKGKDIFNSKCIACHATDKRLVGPAMKGVFERRNAAWVLNIIAVPEKMLAEDKDAKALQEMYGGQVMLNLQLKDDEVRALGEFIRSL